MKNNELKRKLWQQKLSSIAWKNFCESGEIGAYLFYKRISEGESIAGLHSKRRGAKGNRLERERQINNHSNARERVNNSQPKGSAPTKI